MINTGEKCTLRYFYVHKQYTQLHMYGLKSMQEGDVLKKKKFARNKAQAPENSTQAMIKDVAKGALTAVLITLAAILIFAFLIKAMSLDDSVIPFVNQVIKIASIIVAAVIAARGSGPAWLKGILASVVYVIVGFLLFSLIQGELGLFSVLLSDMLAGAVIGLVAVILFAMLPKGKKRK